MDKLNTNCTQCTSGTYGEAGIQDDMHGTLHCNQCGHCVDRHAPSIALEPEAASQFSANGYIPMSAWGKDHHSTLAYAETVMVECEGFQVGTDPRMRSNRRNYRLMAEQCRHPKRPGRTGTQGVVMGASHGTRLQGGQVLANHDDWACLQDAAAAGLFTVGADAVEPGETLHFSPLGTAFAQALRAHKTSGGNFSSFRFMAPGAALVAA